MPSPRPALCAGGGAAIARLGPARSQTEAHLSCGREIEPHALISFSARLWEKAKITRRARSSLSTAPFCRRSRASGTAAHRWARLWLRRLRRRRMLRPAASVSPPPPRRLPPPLLRRVAAAALRVRACCSRGAATCSLSLVASVQTNWSEDALGPNWSVTRLRPKLVYHRIRGYLQGRTSRAVTSVRSPRARTPRAIWRTSGVHLAYIWRSHS